jgi:hypothetical protein
MKMARRTQQKQGDYSGLSATILLAVIAEKEASLSAQGEQMHSQDQQLQAQDQQLQAQDQQLQTQDQQLQAQG